MWLNKLTWLNTLIIKAKFCHGRVFTKNGVGDGNPKDYSAGRQRLLLACSKAESLKQRWRIDKSAGE